MKKYDELSENEKHNFEEFLILTFEFSEDELAEYSGRFYTSIPEIGNRRSDVKETALPF